MSKDSEANLSGRHQGYEGPVWLRMIRILRVYQVSSNNRRSHA